MPTLANITILDRAVAPVSHVLKPRDLKAGRAFCYEDRADFSPVGENQLSYQVDFMPGGRKKSDIKLTIFKVVSETINGVIVNKVLDTTYYTQKMDFGPSFTPAERDAIVGMAMKINDTAANQPILNKITTCSEKNMG